MIDMTVQRYRMLKPEQQKEYDLEFERGYRDHLNFTKIPQRERSRAYQDGVEWGMMEDQRVECERY